MPSCVHPLVGGCSGSIGGGGTRALSLALSPQTGASAQQVHAGSGPTAKPGTNLLLNPNGTAGATSVQGWDAVTIPGWQVQSGLPTVVRYGTPGFPRTTARWPGSRGNLFAGGAGGTARLVQVVSLKPAAHLRFTISAWLGGTKTSDAELTVRFLSKNNKLRGTAAIGPVGRQSRPVLARRTAAGAVPPGATQAQVTLTLATTQTDANGPNAPQAGYDYFYAEAHPSDANYLALAGGSVFGVPPTNPAESNPLYTINARNIGDLITARHETWKAYPQSANGPCDDTVHGYYWNDDQPMLYFADVRGRPAYCASHVVPLERLQTDLAAPATTPNFAWLAPDDCSDMEGCGIAAGDAFLKTELTAIMASKAWRTQRSLAIITFDEDAQDYQRPAQRVPTIILASQGVRPGYVDAARATHYSLLRTIEAALGLGTLTENDRYAQAVTSVFYPERARVPAPAPIAVSTGPRAPAAAAVPVSAPASSVTTAGQPVAWIANYGSDTVTPVNLATRKPGNPVPVGTEPRAIAASPDGKTVYVANSGADTVTPIDTRTGRVDAPVTVGSYPAAVAITG